MRVLVDEDLASRELIRRLRDVAGIDVVEPTLEASDSDVWERAQRQEACILTANARDFIRIAAGASGHHGLVVVYRTSNRETDLRVTDMARGLEAIHDRFPDGLAGLVLVLNDFARV